ncbi:MAG: O-antigen ligase family protein [Patescibacteria group bacterium]
MVSFALAVYFFLFAFFSWRKFSWALLFVVATLPSYLIRFSAGGFPMTVLEGMIYIVFLVWCIRHFRTAKAAIPPRSILLPIGFFLLAATVAVFVSPDMRAAAGVWKAYFFEPILFLLPLLFALRTREVSPASVMRVLSVSVMLLSSFAFFQKLTGFWIPSPWAEESVRRVTSIFAYPNALGLFLGPLVLLFTGRLFPSRAASVKGATAIGYWLLTLLASLLVIVWAHSTGALVGIAAGLIFLFLLLLLKHRNRIRRFHFTFYLLPFTFSMILAVGFIFKTPALRDELLMRDWSGQVRRTIWGETRQMLRDHPISGAGLAGYQTGIEPYHRAKYIEIFLYPHNILLNFWSEVGLLGVAGFFWLMIFFFRRAWKFFLGKDRERAIAAASAMAAMIALLVHGLVDVPYFKNDLSVLFWIIYALGVF